MAVKRRHYRAADAVAVSEFLNRHHRPGNLDGNWLQPAWEYALTHPYLDEHSLGAISVWQDDSEIVAVVHYESRLGEAFFQIHPRYGYLKPAMLDCAEVNLRAACDGGQVCLKAYVNDFDVDLEAIVRSRGYTPLPDRNRPLCALTISRPVPAPVLPAGFRILTLAEENDLEKVDRVLWRGFNHPGDPPEESILGRRKMQSGPTFRPDLAVVVKEPAGSLVAYCGMWCVPALGYAYVEPVATDPEYRRKGLGRAAVMEGIRRCAEEGATVAYVGSDHEFYISMGFGKSHTANCWIRHFSR